MEGSESYTVSPQCGTTKSDQPNTDIQGEADAVNELLYSKPSLISKMLGSIFGSAQEGTPESEFSNEPPDTSGNKAGASVDNNDNTESNNNTRISDKTPVDDRVVNKVSDKSSNVQV